MKELNSKNQDELNNTFLDLQDIPETSKPHLKYLNEAQAAEYIGVSRTTVNQWINRKINPLPHLRWGLRSIRIIQSELEEWLEQYRAGKSTERLVNIKPAQKEARV